MLDSATNTVKSLCKTDAPNKRTKPGADVNRTAQ